MDKWKDIELEKMKVGGNQNAREFLENQPDWDRSMSIQQKYNTKAAALYRDKVMTMAEGKPWSLSTSKAQNYTSSIIPDNLNKGNSGHRQTNGSIQSSGSYNDFGSGYQNTSSSTNYQNLMNTQEFKQQKDDFFGRIQEQNLNRPEYVIIIYFIWQTFLIDDILVCYVEIYHQVKEENMLDSVILEKHHRKVNHKSC